MITYVVIRGYQALSAVSILKNIYAVLLIGQFILFMFVTFFGSTIPMPGAKAINSLSHSFFTLLVYLFFSLLLIDIILVINYFIHFIPVVSTFRFWSFLLLILTISVTLAIGNYRFFHPQTVTLNITAEKPLQHKKIKIVAVSDVHLGVSIDKKQLQCYVNLINAQQPDLVLIGGDLIDRSIKPVIAQQMDEELRQIKATLGVYAVLGNHEYYGESLDAATDFYKKSGINLLKDSVVSVNNQFYIAGRDDKTNPRREELKTVLQYADKEKPILLIDHQPANLNDAFANNIDFQFSGHTHNGQFFPGNLIVKKIFELGYGYMKKGKTNYYVSSGLGIWGPKFRIGTQSELVVINFSY